jgi:hypothetical protein
VDLAGSNLEVDPIVGQDARESFRDPARFQDRIPALYHFSEHRIYLPLM